ncbi:hypothetical protein IV203_035337 [Nitzschia inconspicua]|uniref:RxLR effector protein n=1 Tax=Nitzschia inconspicua TaxID=303405 RepID=A0A9K3PUP9_9STRA|nr:hypothetical protein IV203_035337 [Nitzschia inconspicua]
MISFNLLIATILLSMACLASNAAAFAPVSHVTAIARTNAIAPLNIFDDKERNALTRDSEPEDYFQTNTDKMSDEEKIPIAIAGLVGISLPFILGLIALYAARG